MKTDFSPKLQRVFGVDDALVAAGVTALAAGGQAYAQGKMNRKSIKFAREQYDKQRADAISNFNMVNAYNTPEQQMRRLKEAGLNPHLIYGGSGNVTDAAPVSSVDTQKPQMQTPDVGAIMTGPVNSYLEMRSFQAQQKLINAQILKTTSETNIKNFDLGQKQLLAETQASLLKEILTGKSIDNFVTLAKNEREEKLNRANLEQLEISTRKIFQDVSNETQRHAYDLLQRSQNLNKGAQEIVNMRIDAVNKRLDSQVKNGEITRQQYEKETNRLDQMLKSAQRTLMQERKFESPQDALQFIDKIFGLGTSLIK